jgi:hypothetical protein
VLQGAVCGAQCPSNLSSVRVEQDTEVWCLESRLLSLLLSFPHRVGALEQV